MHQPWSSKCSKCSLTPFTPRLQLFLSMSTLSNAPLRTWPIAGPVAMVKTQLPVAQLNLPPCSVEHLHHHWNQQHKKGGDKDPLLQYQIRLPRRSTPTTTTLLPWTSQVKRCLLSCLSQWHAGRLGKSLFYLDHLDFTVSNGQKTVFHRKNCLQKVVFSFVCVQVYSKLKMLTQILNSIVNTLSQWKIWSNPKLGCPFKKIPTFFS